MHKHFIWNCPRCKCWGAGSREIRGCPVPGPHSSPGSTQCCSGPTTRCRWAHWPSWRHLCENLFKKRQKHHIGWEDGGVKSEKWQQKQQGQRRRSRGVRWCFRHQSRCAPATHRGDHSGAGNSLQPVEETTPEQIPTLQPCGEPTQEPVFPQGVWERHRVEKGKSVRKKSGRAELLQTDCNSPFPSPCVVGLEKSEVEPGKKKGQEKGLIWFLSLFLTI